MQNTVTQSPVAEMISGGNVVVQVNEVAEIDVSKTDADELRKSDGTYTVEYKNGLSITMDSDALVSAVDQAERGENLYITMEEKKKDPPTEEEVAAAKESLEKINQKLNGYTLPDGNGRAHLGQTSPLVAALEEVFTDEELKDVNIKSYNGSHVGYVVLDGIIWYVLLNLDLTDEQIQTIKDKLDSYDSLSGVDEQFREYLENYALLKEKERLQNTINLGSSGDLQVVTAFEVTASVGRTHGTATEIVMQGKLEYTAKVSEESFGGSFPEDMQARFINGYKVLANGTWDKKDTTVKQNADGNWAVTISSNSNSIYVLVYEPESGDTNPDTGGDASPDTGSDNPDTGVTPPEAVLPDKKYLTYIVRWGDTLWALSRKYGCTVAEIVALNGELIRDPDLILVGWELKIPQV